MTMSKEPKQQQQQVPQVIREVRTFLAVHLAEMQTVLRPMNDRYVGTPFYDEGQQLLGIKTAVAAMLLEYFSSIFVYPFQIDLDWVYVKTLNDRIMDVGVTDKIVNALIAAGYIERFAPGRFVRFVNTDSPARKDTVFRIVKAPPELTALKGQVYVEPLSGEHQGGLGYVNYSDLDLIPEEELI